MTDSDETVPLLDEEPPIEEAPTVDPDYPELLEIEEEEREFNDLDTVYQDVEDLDPDDFEPEDLPDELRGFRELGQFREGTFAVGRTIFASRVAANAASTSKRGTYWGV